LNYVVQPLLQLFHVTTTVALAWFNQTLVHFICTMKLSRSA